MRFTSPSKSFRHACRAAALALCAVAAAGGGGEDDHAAAVTAAASDASEPSFRDGARLVKVERLGPATIGANGRALARVRLVYPGGRAVEAGVDRTAIVRLDPGAEAEIDREGARLVKPLMPSIGLWLAEDTTGGDGVDLASRLAGAAGRGVRHAIPNLYLRVEARAEPYTPTDPRYPGQWYFENLGMPNAWGLTRGDAGTSIVVVDTGCDLAHPDLAAKMDPGLDVVDGDDDPSYQPGYPGAAHGTACAGIIAAATDNGEGIAGGCPECRLRCVRMLSDVAIPISANVEAFQFALDVDASVVSNSWGFVDPMPVPAALADAINNVADTGRGGKGALVLFAAGNDDRVIGDDELEAVRGVLCIGAINNFDESTPFTNSGNALDLVAPTGTLTTDISGAEGEDPGDYTSLFGGTSSACPVAAGIAGLLASAAPDKTSAELYDILIETARPAPFAQPDANGHDPVYGYGIIQPEQALRAAMGLPPEDLPDGGIGGAGGGGGGGLSTPASDAAADESGCSCSTPGTTGSAGSVAMCLAGIVAAVARPRRRR